MWGGFLFVRFNYLSIKKFRRWFFIIKRKFYWICDVRCKNFINVCVVGIGFYFGVFNDCWIKFSRKYVNYSESSGGF